MLTGSDIYSVFNGSLALTKARNANHETGVKSKRVSEGTIIMVHESTGTVQQRAKRTKIVRVSLQGKACAQKATGWLDAGKAPHSS